MTKFWVQGPIGPKLENYNFLTKPSNRGVYGLAGALQSFLKLFGSWEQMFGPTAFWPHIQKFAIFWQNPTILVFMELPGPLQSF